MSWISGIPRHNYWSPLNNDDNSQSFEQPDEKESPVSSPKGVSQRCTLLHNITLSRNNDLITEISKNKTHHYPQNQNFKNPSGPLSVASLLSKKNSLYTFSSFQVSKQKLGPQPKTFPSKTFPLGAMLDKTTPKIVERSSGLQNRGENLKGKAILHANFARKYCPRAYLPGELAYQLETHLRTSPGDRELQQYKERECFLGEVKEKLENVVDFTEETFQKIVRELSQFAQEHDVTQTFSDAVLDLIESKDLCLLVSLLYWYQTEKDPEAPFPKSDFFTKAVSMKLPLANQNYGWLLVANEHEMIRRVLQSPDLCSPEALQNLFEKMIYDSSVSTPNLYSALRELRNFLIEYDFADLLCFPEKRKYLVRLRLVLDLAVQARDKQQVSVLSDLKQEVYKIHIWNYQHVFQPEIGAGVKGYHVLKHHDIYEDEEDRVVLLKDPIIQERGLYIAFYEVHKPGPSYKRLIKYSSFYKSMDKETLARGIQEILSNPINDVGAMRRGPERTYIGTHLDLDGNEVMTQAFVNYVKHIPEINSCFPVIYRSVELDSDLQAVPASAASIVRRSENGLQKGSPLKGKMRSPTNFLLSSLCPSPLKTKLKPKDKVKKVDEKLLSALQRLPFEILPTNSSDKMLLRASYSTLQGHKNIQEFLMSAVDQVVSPAMENQLVRILKQSDIPFSYSDVMVYIEANTSDLRKIVERLLH